MNRLNGTLAAATLLLAGITAHLAHAVAQQRALRPIGPVAAGQPHVHENPSDNLAPAEADTARTPNTRFDPENIALQEFRLEELRDPSLRTQRMQELVEVFQGNFAAVAPAIGMSPEELRRFALARAEQALESLQRDAQCQLDPDCDVFAFGQARQVSTRQREDDLLGPEKAARLKAFKSAHYENNLVFLLNQSLPASSQLPAAQAGRLAMALSAETQKFDAEAQLYGLEVHKHVGWGATELHSAYRPDAPDELQQHEESVKRYNQRLYRVASTVLAPAQLTDFKAIQDRALAEFLQWMREEVIAANARKDSNP